MLYHCTRVLLEQTRYLGRLNEADRTITFMGEVERHMKRILLGSRTCPTAVIDKRRSVQRHVQGRFCIRLNNRSSVFFGRLH